MRLRPFLLYCLLASVVSLKSVGQTGLSQNSGINSADTWVTLDLTVQIQDA